MLEQLSSIGLTVRNTILGLAEMLRDEWTPGAVSLGLVLAALLFVGLILIQRRKRTKALRWAVRVISVAPDRKAFVSQIPEVHRAFTQAREAKSSWPKFFRDKEYRRAIGVAWGEYHETVVLPEADSTEVVRNSIRPSTFFDTEDLGFAIGWWRILPGLFVSIGLLLTFLGLIAALTAIGGDEITDNSLRELLNAASAKFIMSLTGLACSILLTIVLRVSADGVERNTRNLCHAIEKRLRFQSLEEIAAEQLRATREQGSAMRQVATEMVAELARPLREELPNAIGASIKAEMEPILQRLGQTSEQGLGQMVDNLSERLSSDVGEALSLAAGRLGEAADRLTDLTGRMESGTGRIGAEYESLAARMSEQMATLQSVMREEASRNQAQMSEGVERLMAQMTESLAAIRENTAQGAQAIADAAADMRGAAEGFRTEIETASSLGATTVSAEMERAAQAAGGAIASATAELTTPLGELASRLQSAAEATQGSAEGLRRLAEAAKGSGDAITRGSERFELASNAMAEAARPIRESIDGLRGVTRDMSDGVRLALDGAMRQSSETAKRTREALEAASTILGDQKRGISAAMDGLALALQELQGHGDRIDSIDEKLGRAFEQYREQVEATMQGAARSVTQIVEILNPALDTMKAVVEQAEEFAPKSRANGGQSPNSTGNV